LTGARLGDFVRRLKAKGYRLKASPIGFARLAGVARLGGSARLRA
jgi:hypothetical protein